MEIVAGVIKNLPVIAVLIYINIFYILIAGLCYLNAFKGKVRYIEKRTVIRNEKVVFENIIDSFYFGKINLLRFLIHVVLSKFLSTGENRLPVNFVKDVSSSIAPRSLLLFIFLAIKVFLYWPITVIPYFLKKNPNISISLTVKDTKLFPLTYRILFFYIFIFINFIKKSE